MSPIQQVFPYLRQRESESHASEKSRDQRSLQTSCETTPDHQHNVHVHVAQIFNTKNNAPQNDLEQRVGLTNKFHHVEKALDTSITLLLNP